MNFWLDLFLVVASYIVGRSLRPRNPKPAPPEPVCGCQHHAAYHETTEDGGLGQCKKGWWEVNTERGVVCTCNHYVGPLPLPEYIP